MGCEGACVYALVGVQVFLCVHVCTYTVLTTNTIISRKIYANPC